MPSGGWTFFVFFYNIVRKATLLRQLMKQKPYNDNLVMASIENLYEQASFIDRPRKADLQRRNPNNLPIIGSLPVRIRHEQKKGPLDDFVLTGRLQAVFTDDNHNTFSARQNSNQGLEDNPFLAIRQAIIAAGDEKNKIAGQPTPSEQAKSASEKSEIGTSEASLVKKPPAEPAERTFASKLVGLIETEIERRVAEQTSNVQKSDRKKSTLARTRKKQTIPEKKPNDTKPRKTQKSNQKSTSQAATKKPSNTKRN